MKLLKVNFSVWRPYLFGEKGALASVNSDLYAEILRNFLEPKLTNLGNLRVWFRQGGSKALTVRRSMEIFRELFPEHLISLPGDVG